MDGWVGVFTFPKNFWGKNEIFFLFFNVFSYEGSNFNLYFGTNKPQVALADREFIQKSTLIAMLTLI